MRPGRLRDVFFFLRHIVLGAQQRHFSELFLRPFDQLMLVKRCCHALLRNAPIARGRVCGDRFLVAELAGGTVGAALTETSRRGDRYSVLLAYVVVDPAVHRKGVASALVRQVIQQAPAPSTVVCACAPASKGMMKLLARLQFKRLQRAVEIPGLVAPRLFQYGKPAVAPALMPPPHAAFLPGLIRGGRLATGADRS